MSNEDQQKLAEYVKVHPLTSAAFVTIYDELIESLGLPKSEFLTSVMQNQPVLSAVLNTFFGSIGIVLIPTLSEEIYEDENLVGALSSGLDLAKSYGATGASMTGLIPSATSYGNDLKTIDANFKLSTGHGSTVSAMVLNIEHALNNTGRNIESETVACIGLGAIGLATLKLMLSVLQHPKKLILRDPFIKKNAFEQVREDLVNLFHYRGEILIDHSFSMELSEDIYKQSRFIIGATNVPDIIDTDCLRSGAIIVDDSAPHIFNYQTCMARFKKEKDILVLQGGKLTLPSPIDYQYTDLAVLSKAKKRFEDMRSARPCEITGCVLGGILPVSSETIPPTLGLVDVSTAKLYYNFFKKVGIAASSFQCQDHYYSASEIKSFSSIGLN